MKDVRILLVEDNAADVELTKEALKASKLYMDIDVSSNGEEALKQLETGAKYDLILLDLNMPRMDGREFLSVAKADERWKSIPVVVLTSSEAEEDVETSYLQHANCYVQKPVDFGQFVKIVQSIDEFWFNIVKLPPRN